MGRLRTVLGLALIVFGTLFLSRALTHPLAPPMPALPPLPAMPNMPALPAMPDLPPLPPVPPLLPVAHPSFWHPLVGLHPLVLVLLVVLAAFWLRRRSAREQPLA